jgi:hypothetical protein
MNNLPFAPLLWPPSLLHLDFQTDLPKRKLATIRETRAPMTPHIFFFFSFHDDDDGMIESE